MGNDVIGARGSDIVRISAAGVETTVRQVPGVPTSIRPGPAGAIDLVTLQGDRETGWRLSSGGGLSKVGEGARGSVTLTHGRGGNNLLIPASAASQPVVDTSLDGQAILTTGSTSESLAGKDVLPSTTRRPSPAARLVDRTTGALLADTLPSPSPAGVIRQSAATRAPATISPDVPGGPFNQTTPTCAVPRDDPNFQVPQPSGAQVNWAVQQAVRDNLLSLAQRPSGYLNLGLTAYQPSADFPAPALTAPSGDSTSIPPQIVNGILAQESNWDQASFHVPRGSVGNPLIADYYGFNATGGSIDFDQADCGYGIAQVTDFMTVASTAISQHGKMKVAEDYAENIAAALGILADKWDQLFSLGITIGDANPATLENWYFSIWAYNTGVHQPSGSNPYGLGWVNNPINPIYPANRNPFLSDPTDAAHPQNWPYQEKVFGWIEHPLPDAAGNPLYASLGSNLTRPGSYSAFCSLTQNSCDPTRPSAPCQRSDLQCWWHAPVGSFTGALHTGFFDVSTSAREPAATDPVAPSCPTQPMAGSGVKVVTVNNSPPGNINLVGCPARVSDGTFSVSFDGSTAQFPVGIVDWHQLGGGSDGHFFFTHTDVSTDVGYRITATWAPNISGTYLVSAFVPSYGATARQADYVINATGRALMDGTNAHHRRVDQNAVSNNWVNLGFFTFNSGDTVQLSNVSADPVGLDVGFDAMAFSPVGLFSGLATIGDSYTSGEGTTDSSGALGWDAGTDSYDLSNLGPGGTIPPGVATDWNMCHRSPAAYGRLYASASTSYQGPVMHMACSGAVSQNAFINNSGQGQPQFADGLQLDNLPPPQFVRRILATFGGNDIGFGGIAKECVTDALISTYCYVNHPPDSNGMDNIDHNIQNLIPQLVQLYEKLSRASSGDVVISTYPKILPDNVTINGSWVCSGVPVQDRDAVWLAGKQTELNSAIRSARQQAIAAGFTNLLLNDEEGLFAGHDVCASDPWFNNVDVWKALTATNYSASKWALHPNLEGQQAWARDLATNVGH